MSSFGYFKRLIQLTIIIQQFGSLVMKTSPPDASSKPTSTSPEKKKSDSEWSKLINGIVRPPRSQYKDSALGARTFILNEIQYSRKDLKVIHQNKKIDLTLYQPTLKNNWLILYLHGNSSSRMEATGIIKYLPHQVSLASFDFIGCGNNIEDDVISLGYRESKQVASVVEELEGRGFKVILWGRSMGAATALKYGKAPLIVADSSFKSFKSLCKQVAKRHSPKFVPNCLISCFFPCVFSKLRSDIQKKGDYDIQGLNIVKDVKNINPDTCLIFLSGDEDLLIDKVNSERLCNTFTGKNKHLEVFKGGHNTRRPEQTIKKVMSMIGSFVEQEQAKSKEVLSKTVIDLKIDVIIY